MQTFLPFKNIGLSAAVLDSKRLNKQVLEAYQILNTLSGRSAGWRRHPAVLMWEGHEWSLYDYAMRMAWEASERGIKTDKNVQNLNLLKNLYSSNWGAGDPDWMLDSRMVRIMHTHQANLYKKDPEFYFEFAEMVNSMFNEPCCDRCNYYWPTHVEAKNAELLV